MSNPRILHIIDSLGVGGAEKVVINDVRLLPEFEHHLIYLNDPGDLVKELPASCAVTKWNFRSIRDVFRCMRLLRKYIRQHKIDIIHSHLYWSNIIARMIIRRDVKVFNSIHAISSEASYKIRRSSLYLEKMTYRKRHHLVCVSGEVLKDFDKWIGIKGKATVLYNTIDDKYFAAGPRTHFSKGSLRMVAVGNLRWQKNYPYLIEAFKEMPSTVSLDIYGEGDLRQEFQQQIDAHQLNIRLCGVSKDLASLLPQYDVFVMSSFYEGFSLGLMEAMATGLPALLSDIPVLKEAGGDAALYFDIKNESTLVQKVDRILADENILPALSRLAWERASRLSRKTAYIEKLSALYKAV